MRLSSRVELQHRCQAHTTLRVAAIPGLGDQDRGWRHHVCRVVGSTFNFSGPHVTQILRIHPSNLAGNRLGLMH